VADKIFDPVKETAAVPPHRKEGVLRPHLLLTRVKRYSVCLQGVDLRLLGEVADLGCQETARSPWLGQNNLPAQISWKLPAEKGSGALVRLFSHADGFHQAPDPSEQTFRWVSHALKPTYKLNVAAAYEKNRS
jgi:hypothetical protein